MGYRMEYGSGNRGVVYSRVESMKIKYMLILLIPAIILCCLFRKQIVDLILPGDPEVTKNAISTFIGELREGEHVTDAFSSFCKVILDGEHVF